MNALRGADPLVRLRKGPTPGFRIPRFFKLDKSINYKDLLGPILDSDAHKAQPLSDEELCIIQRVAGRFPKNQDVYEAAHRERVWQKSRVGALLSYSSASELTEI